MRAFLIFEKGMSKKIASGFLGFVTVLFLNIWKKNEQKNFPSFFRICMSVFFIFEKGMCKEWRQVV